MKQMKRGLGLALTGTLLVGMMAACSAPGVKTNPSAQPSPDPSDIAYQTTGIVRDTALFTVDGEPVPAEEYLFWLYNSIEAQKQAGGLADDAAWAGQIEELPAADFLKKDAMETAKLYRIMRTKAAAEGVTLTEQDKAQMQEQVTAVETELATQGMTLQMWLDQRCITTEAFNRLNEVYYLNAGLVEKLSVEGGSLAPTEEGMAAMLEEYGLYQVKHILLKTMKEDGTAFSDEEKAATKKEADDMLASIRAAADPAVAFDTAMKERSEDGRNPDGTLAAPDGYLAYPGQMVPEFETASMALNEGDISEVVESDFGYHIIMRLSADTEEARKEYFPNYQMNKVIDQWSSEAKVETTPAYDTLNIKDFYDKMQPVIAEREAQAAAVLAPSATPAPTGEPSASATPVATPEASTPPAS